nr:hypothetical protein [Tanacetum cinerariifolium]
MAQVKVMMKDEPVRQGHFYCKAKNERMVKIVVIMEKQGEIFLDVVSYIDIDPFDDYLMKLYHHIGNLAPQFISKQNLQQILEEVYQVYPAGITELPGGGLVEDLRMIRFYGWQDVDDYFCLAIKQWKCDLVQFVSVNNCESLYILRERAIAIYKIRGNYKSVHNIINPRNVFIMDNGKPKIGFLAFMTEDDEGCSQSTNIKDLACLLLYYSTRGAYKFSMDVGLEELDNPPTLHEFLSHPWLWDTHKVTSFIIAFSDFIKRHSYSSALADRDFQSSLVRIMRNEFNHHEEMSEGVKKGHG